MKVYGHSNKRYPGVYIIGPSGFTDFHAKGAKMDVRVQRAGLGFRVHGQCRPSENASHDDKKKENTRTQLGHRLAV